MKTEHRYTIHVTQITNLNPSLLCQRRAQPRTLRPRVGAVHTHWGPGTHTHARAVLEDIRVTSLGLALGKSASGTV
jgi:hypothetical protein